MHAEGVGEGPLLSVDPTQVEGLAEDREAVFKAKLLPWLDAQENGWTALDENARKAVLDETDALAREHAIRTEKARAMLVHCFVSSGAPEAFGARDDVRAALRSPRADEFGKVRRLHAIAYDLSRGTSLFTGDAAPEDTTFAVETPT